MIREVAKAKSCRTLQAWGQSGVGGTTVLGDRSGRGTLKR